MVALVILFVLHSGYDDMNRQICPVSKEDTRAHGHGKKVITNTVCARQAYGWHWVGVRFSVCVSLSFSLAPYLPLFLIHTFSFHESHHAPLIYDSLRIGSWPENNMHMPRADRCESNETDDVIQIWRMRRGVLSICHGRENILWVQPSPHLWVPPPM